MSLSFEIREGRRWFHRGTPAEVRAIDGVDWTVEAGEFALVTGPSGSGKTTLLALLGALDAPTEGTVLVAGEDPRRLGDGGRARLRRQLGLAFAAAPLLPGMTLRDNVAYGLVPLGVSTARRREAADPWLERLDLLDRGNATAEELSTGETQRAVLARALVPAPKALIVDEPLANLDAATVRTVVEVIREFQAGGGTVIVSSHLHESFGAVGKRLRLRDGRVDRGA